MQASCLLATLLKCGHLECISCVRSGCGHSGLQTGSWQLRAVEKAFDNAPLMVHSILLEQSGGYNWKVGSVSSH